MKRQTKTLKQSKAEKFLTGLNEQDSRISLIQMLIPIGLRAVQEELEKEIQCLAGPRYSRQSEQYYRWGRNDGWVHLGDQKVHVEVPRLRDRVSGKEEVLKTYKALQRPQIMQDQVLARIISGLSHRNYEEAALTTAESFGISRSSVSRQLIRASAKKLEELLNRDLSCEDIVAIFMDGKYFAEMNMIVALGVTLEGKKIILGFVESGSENQKVISQFLNSLKERGLKTDQEILFVSDGAKGLLSGIQAAFGERGIIQRCQWHKMENVVSYLPKKHREMIRQKMKKAYHSEDYNQAKSRLNLLHKELKLLNESAAKSLEEGLEETLTLHRLGVFKELGSSFKTTNCIESVFSQVGQYTDKVDSWKNSNHRQRWLACSLLKIEPCLRKVKGHKYLPMLRQSMAHSLAIGQKKCA